MSLSALSGKRMISFAAAASLVLAGGVLVTTAAPAAADPGPIAQRTSNQMTADALPTEQIDNGVVWAETVGNGIAYAGGDFSNVRPPGAAKGTNLTPRGNLVAVNLATGALVTSFAPSLNGQVKAVALSPDGTRLYVGGAFTTAGVVGGTQVARNHIAAYSTVTGQLITTFNASVNSGVNAIAATSTTVYVGGVFSASSGNSRTRLAAFNASTGSLLGWAPTADNDVDALVMSPDNSRVIVAGAFANVNGALARGSAALDASTGASLQWSINQTVYSYNTNLGGAILSLSTDGNAIYGTAWNYGDPSNFEGTFSADPNTGNINWLEDCHGDTYDSFATNGAIYVVSHEHFCSNVGAFPDTNPRVWHRTTAFTTTATGTLTNNQEGGTGYGNFGGQPSPSMINWYPDLPAGTYTGQAQAAWSVNGNSQYIIEGGEFQTVNGTPQYGLVRFAVPSLAPNKRGPMISGTSAAATPNTLITSNSTVRISWQANWDQDDQNLTYSIYRLDKGTTTPVYQTTAASQFWNLPVMGFTDTGLQAGTTYTYYLRTTDPSGNAQRSNNFTVNIPANFSVSTYAQDVLNQGASHFWRLDEKAGTTTSTDWAGYNNLLESSTVTNGVPGAIAGDSDTAASFDGSATGVAGAQAKEAGPNVFSVGAWVNTTTTSGGKIVGFGDSQSGTSGSYDRHIYMDNAGHIVFGVYNNGTYTVTSPGTYNDGQWHQIVGTLSSSGLALYIDGKRIGVNGGTAQGQPYSGYWRVGGDNLNGWPSRPSSDDLRGSIDEVAVYPTALTLAQVQQQYTDSGRTLNIPAPPSDAYGKAVYADSPDLYWRLDDATGPTAIDTSPNGSNGAYAGGVTYKTPSPVTGSSGTGVTFDGANGTVGSQQQFNDPTVYSEEAWFKTSTTHGGKIIGFGNAQSGNSNNYDRHVYMENSGQLDFGVWTGTTNIAQTPGSYNDGQWHYVVATQGSDGMKLYVDGQLQATNPQTQAQAYAGYWRVGGDSDWGGDSAYLAGSMDEVAVYSYELTSAQIQAHYKASPAASNTKPVASFTNSCTGLSCNFDASGSHDPDGTIASYSWDFGDGKTDVGATPAHKYASNGSYTVALTVTDDQGATDTTTAQVSVTAPANQPPTASFTKSCTNLTCNFDGTGSQDSDGTIASYSWDFGDGKSATGATPSHAYAASGSYPVTLTVTDDQGATGAATTEVDVTAPANQPPTASFTKSCTNLVCSFDGTGSQDADGSIASYSWDFGDGKTDTGVKPSHTYGSGGTYTVQLTVTDDQGATDTAQATVTVAPNQPPTASFTQSCVNLVCSFDGTASTDPDGTVTDYAWDFGDGTSGSVAKPSHTFGTAGTYTVKLTVTDNQGSTGVTTTQVTVTGSTLYAADTFNRTVSNGWGSADTGGSYTLTGSSSLFSVGSGVGTMNLKAPGAGPVAYLNGVSAANINEVVDATTDAQGTGNGLYCVYLARHTSSGDYRLKLRLLPGGVVHLALSKIVSGTETVLKEVAISGLTYHTGDVLRTRFTVTGSGTTTLTGKVWVAGTTEPTAVQISAADSTAALQSAGGIAIYSYLAANATTAPVNVKYDNLTVNAS